MKAHLMMLFKKNLPSMIPLPKQKEIVCSLEQMLADARIEKFGDVGNMKALVPKLLYSQLGSPAGHQLTSWCSQLGHQ